MSIGKAIQAQVSEGPNEASSTTSVTTESIMEDDMEAQASPPDEVQLSPIPSDDPDDPLNWPMWLKVVILVQTSMLAAIGGLNTATINPALLQLSSEFGVDRVRASYQTTVCIALNGIAPWLWVPLAYKYGRRPVYLGTTLLGFVTILGCAYTQTYTQLLIARIFNGLFPVGFALGATTVTDLFFFHQRGRAMGFFTVTVVNGSHLAPIIGGLLGHHSGWRWIFKFLAIVDGILFIVALLCLPETMYHCQRKSNNNTASLIKTPSNNRSDVIETEHSSNISLPPAQTIPSHISTTTLDIACPTIVLPRTKVQTYLYRLRLYSPNPNYKINYVTTIMSTIRLFLSPTAVFPALYYASIYGFASILPAVTVAAIFTEFFHWNTLRIGLSYGAALTVGGILGECFAGWICDAIVKREQARLASNPGKQNTNGIRPEVRLRPIWPGAILTPAGLLIYGFTLQYHTHPALPLFGMALSCFGLQIITTCTYTYAIDCHTSRFDTNKSHLPATTSSSNLSPDPSPKPGAKLTNHNHEPQQMDESESESERDKDLQSSKPAQVAQLFNFIRQMFGFTFAFYVVDMGDAIGYQWTFTIFAFCGGVLAFMPIFWLIFRSQTSSLLL